MTQFRPCIDIHEGKVKQIVGGSLNDQGATTNFISDKSPRYYAELYKSENLLGGHVISLGKGNEEAVSEALKAWPDHLQYGGGVTLDNAADFIAIGASKVIVTSYLFVDDEFSWERLEKLRDLVGKERLVLDLSCRKRANSWFIATNRWQTVTSLEVCFENISKLEDYCSEFLIHAADVEGLQSGMDLELIEKLGQWVSIPTTYAGGASSLEDLKTVSNLSKGKLDLTIGSALDIFGGKKVKLKDCIQWNRSVL